MTEAITHAAVVAILATLISESVLLSKIRKRLGFDLLYCPICLSFWLASPYIITDGLYHYFLTLAFANVWMLVVLRVYAELDAASGDDDEEQNIST